MLLRGLYARVCRGVESLLLSSGFYHDYRHNGGMGGLSLVKVVEP